MKTYLKIKIMSLAAEAAIIRKHEKRSSGELRTGLYLHRIHDVRQEARSALLAYGFLRGRAYHRMEAKAHRAPNWKRVEALVTKYGEDDPRDRAQRFAAWKAEAEAA